MSLIKSVTNLPASGPWPTLDPFLFCVHHNDKYPEANHDFSPNASLLGRDLGNDFSNNDGWSMYHGTKVPGFPKHPHRGFETITIVNKGIIDHSDSLGASARFGDGDTQWLTAGDGLNHSEMFPLFKKNSNNQIDFFQIWINLPSKDKRVKPNFEIYWDSQIPKVEVEDENGILSNLEIISGNYKNIYPSNPPPDSWARQKENEVAIWVIELKKGGSFTIPKAKNNPIRSIYIMPDSKVSIEKSQPYSNVHINLSSVSDAVLDNLDGDARILMLQGKAINEPVVQYGPFVMNNKAEIQEAFDDYNKNGFGKWNWEDSGPVHGKYKGKFAKLINGKVLKPLQ